MNALLIPNLVERREACRAGVLMKLNGIAPEPETPPVNILHVLHNPHDGLVEDTVAIYDALIARMGQAGLGAWMLGEYPWLLKEETSLLRIWWVLDKKLQEPA